MLQVLTWGYKQSYVYEGIVSAMHTKLLTTSIAATNSIRGIATLEEDPLKNERGEEYDRKPEKQRHLLTQKHKNL